MNCRKDLSLIVAAALCLIALGAVLALGSSSVQAAGATLYVAPGGACGGVLPCYATIQAAVDAAKDGDTIKVAAGAYTDIHNRPAPPDYPDPPGGGLNQVVYVDKAVTIRGGYLTTNGYAEPPNPLANPSTLDAGQQGRAMVVASGAAIENLHMRGGDATDLGGHPFLNSDAGGGVYLYQSDNAKLTENVVLENTAISGGGLYLYRCNSVTLFANTVSSNTAGTKYYDFYGGGGLYSNESNIFITGNTFSDNWANAANGGGLYLRGSEGTVSYNTISDNKSYWSGGGVFLYQADAITLTGNHIADNRTTTEYGQGGGVCLEFSDATLAGNVIVRNHADGQFNPFDGGGGVYLHYSDSTLSGNWIMFNDALNSGGGLGLRQSDATLDNNVILDNQASGTGTGAGVHVYRSNPRFRHNTLARNHGGDGSGLWVGGTTPSTVVMTNTILSSHSAGIFVEAGSAAMLEATLWHANAIDTGGAGTTSIGTINVQQDPLFAADGYHLTMHSPAINAGVDAGLTVDIDDDPRGVLRDIGADESVWMVRVPLVLRDVP